MQQPPDNPRVRAAATRGRPHRREETPHQRAAGTTTEHAADRHPATSPDRRGRHPGHTPPHTWREQSPQCHAMGSQHQLHMPQGIQPDTFPPTLSVGPSLAIVAQAMPAGIWAIFAIRQTPGHTSRPNFPMPFVLMTRTQTNPIRQAGRALDTRTADGVAHEGARSALRAVERGTRRPKGGPALPALGEQPQALRNFGGYTFTLPSERRQEQACSSTDVPRQAPPPDQQADPPTSTDQQTEDHPPQQPQPTAGGTPPRGEHSAAAAEEKPPRTEQPPPQPQHTAKGTPQGGEHAAAAAEEKPPRTEQPPTRLQQQPPPRLHRPTLGHHQHQVTSQSTRGQARTTTGQNSCKERADTEAEAEAGLQAATTTTTTTRHHNHL